MRWRPWPLPGTGVAALLAFLLLYVPIVVVIALSFNANPLITVWSGVSLDWYAALLQDRPLLEALRNSAGIAVCAASLGTLLAAGAALGMQRAAFRGRGGVEVLIGLPLLVPEIVGAIAALLAFVVIGLPLGIGAIVAVHTVLVLPFAYLPIRTRLQGLDPALAEAAADLYAGPWRAFRRITLPLVWPGIVSGLMLAFVVSLSDFTFAFFLSAPGTTTLPVYVFGMIRVGLTPVVNAISTVLILLSLALLVVSQRLGRHH